MPKELKQRMQDYFQTMWSLNHGIDIYEVRVRAWGALINVMSVNHTLELGCDANQSRKVFDGRIFFFVVFVVTPPRDRF